LRSILSAAMLLEHFGLTTEAELVRLALRMLKLNITTPLLTNRRNAPTSKVGRDLLVINNPKTQYEFLLLRWVDLQSYKN
jgi:3-isopropylmalate dehydrogenase